MRLLLVVAALAILPLDTGRLEGQAPPRLDNPPSIHAPRGYSHVAVVPAGNTMVFIAGQVALDREGRLVGANDLRAQTVQVFENLRLALESAGATFKDVIKLNYYVLDAGQIAVVREVRDQYLNRAAPPASTLVEVRRLFRDDVLIEVEAVAVTRP